MGVLEWLLILGIALVYAFVLIAVIWLVFRRSRRRPKEPNARPEPPARNAASAAADETDRIL